MMCQTVGRARKEAPTLLPLTSSTVIATHMVFPTGGRARKEQSSNIYDVFDDLSRTRGTTISLSFHKPAFIKSGRAREQSSHSYNMSRAQGAPVPRSFFKPPLFQSMGARERSANRSEHASPISPPRLQQMTDDSILRADFDCVLGDGDDSYADGWLQWKPCCKCFHACPRGTIYHLRQRTIKTQKQKADQV